VYPKDFPFLAALVPNKGPTSVVYLSNDIHNFLGNPKVISLHMNTGFTQPIHDYLAEQKKAQKP
jgi:hypothetical protein